MTTSLYSKYEKSTITKFDIIGSYFVGIYYNELYLKAEQLRNEGKYNSLTQAYQQVLYNYIQFTQHKDFFRKTILGIHNYFISTTKYVSMTYKECIDFVVSEFIPNHLFENIKEVQKYNILNNILINCLKIFTERILHTQISPIIDNHYEQANINILQNIYLEIILLEKDKMYAKFINPEKRNNSIPSELYNTIQQQLKKLTENNMQLVKKNELLTKELEHIKKTADIEINKLKQMGIQVIEENKKLQNKLENLQKNNLNEYERPQIRIAPSENTNTVFKQEDNNTNLVQEDTSREETSYNKEIGSDTNLTQKNTNTVFEQEYNDDTNMVFKQELDTKQKEILNELNDDDDIMDAFTNFGSSDDTQRIQFN